MISPETTVADAVLEQPGRARVFERLGIDYCCGGGRSLADACAAQNVPLAEVIAELESAEPDGTLCDVGGLDAAGLSAHIVETHHAYLRHELPRIATLVDKVDRAHGDRDPRLHDVLSAFTELRQELEAHTEAEEAGLFPALVAGDASSVSAFEDDHDAAGALLARLSELTDGYDAEHARCNTHRALLHALGELQGDLHRHIHEENNILFPLAR